MSGELVSPAAAASSQSHANEPGAPDTVSQGGTQRTIKSLKRPRQDDAEEREDSNADQLNILQPSDNVTVIVGGSTFVFDRSTLTRRPSTMLGTMFSDANRAMWEGKSPYHFPERDGRVFQRVAAFYQTGKLDVKADELHVFRECDFWLVQPMLNPLLEPFLGEDPSSYVPRLAQGVLQVLEQYLGRLPLVGISSDASSSPEILLCAPGTPPRLAESARSLNSMHALLPSDWPAVHGHDACAECAEGDVLHVLLWAELRGRRPPPARVTLLTLLVNDTLYSSILAHMAPILRGLQSVLRASEAVKDKSPAGLLRQTLTVTLDGVFSAALLTSSSAFLFIIRTELAKRGVSLDVTDDGDSIDGDNFKGVGRPNVVPIGFPSDFQGGVQTFRAERHTMPVTFKDTCHILRLTLRNLGADAVSA